MTDLAIATLPSFSVGVEAVCVYIKTMIVYRPHRRKRPPKPPQAPYTGPRIVTHPHKYDRPRRVPEPDAEADARVAAFFARMIRPVS
jgi:hypothetical protein